MKTTAELKDQLGQISSAMMRIHKAIMENEMELLEAKTMKPLGPNERLQVLLNDPDFAWLRNLSQLMSAVDEVYFQKENYFQERMKYFIETRNFLSRSNFIIRFRSSPVVNHEHTVGNSSPFIVSSSSFLLLFFSPLACLRLSFSTHANLSIR